MGALILGALILGALILGALILGALILGTPIEILGALILGALILGALISGALISGALILGALISGALILTPGMLIVPIPGISPIPGILPINGISFNDDIFPIDTPKVINILLMILLNNSPIEPVCSNIIIIKLANCINKYDINENIADNNIPNNVNRRTIIFHIIVNTSIPKCIVVCITFITKSKNP